MDRLACVDLPAFPLQLLLRQQPSWRTCPVAVVDQDKPQGILLWVNERARAHHILPGMRYAAALSLAGDLRAAEVPQSRIDRAAAAIRCDLRRFTPHVESADDQPGVFWLDASGLQRLHDSLGKWAGQVRSALKRSGFRTAVVVGFGRFGSYATAREAAGANRAVRVFGKPDAEQTAARRVSLDCLALPPSALEMLFKLGVETVGRFIDLPHEGIEKRFGPEVARLHRLASGELCVPLQPEKPVPPVVQRLALDHPETAVSRLMLVVEQLMPPLLEMLADRCQALVEVKVGFRFERMGDHVETVRPAEPTLSAASVLELIRLRLEAVRRLPEGVVEVMLAGRGVRAARRQLELFAERPRRDLAAADRALARIRAAFGDDSVTRARLREGHLPEGSFTWDAIDRLAAAQPHQTDGPQLVRRIFEPPVPLPSRPRHEPDGWMLRGLKQGPVERVLGPYIVSGGWWNRTVHREYHFAETRKGELLWVYYDRGRRRWYLHGRVE